MNSICNDSVVQLKTVGFALTMQCNFECAHCINESSPRKTDKISLPDALSLLNEIAEESSNICFTGGESFLQKNILFDCIAAAKNKGLTVSIVSNGFWAKGNKETLEILKDLVDVGVSGICISLDRFHLQFVDYKNALRVATLSKEVGINHLIRVCSIKNDKFANEIVDNEKYSGVNFQRVRVLRLGRAKFLPIELFNSVTEWPDGCCTTVRSPIVLPDGTVQACCGPGVEFHDENPLNLGNWHDTRLSLILRHARTNPLVMALHNQGPRFVAQLIKSIDPSLNLNIRNNYTGICELCCDICNHPAAVHVMENVFQEPAMKLKLIAAQVYQQSFSYLKNEGYLDLPNF